MTRTLIFILTLLFFSGNILAQNSIRDEFKKEQERLRRQHRHQRDSLVTDYERFRDSCNAEYAKYLAKAWSQFEGHKGVDAPKEEMRLPEEVLEKMKHPEKMVTSQKTASAAETAFNPRGAVIAVRDFFRRLHPPKPMVKERQSKWTRRKTRKDMRPNVDVKESDELPERTLEEEAVVNLMPFDFYGTGMQVNMGKLRDELQLPKAESTAVSNAWTICSKADYVSLIQDCLSLKQEHHLGDWAYLQMIKTLAEEAFGKDTNESIFLTAYIYCQSGYRIRLGSDGDKLLMLFASHHQIYGLNYLTMDNQDFYLMQEAQSLYNIHACDKAINAQEQPLSLWMKEPMSLDDTFSKQRLVQSDKYPNIRMEVQVNENLIRYYNDYPNSQLGTDVLTRWAIYADTPMSEDVKSQIYPALQEAMRDLPEDEQVCRLLSLIQPRDTTFGVNPWQSLVYDYDNIRWGADRAFFPEETLYYPYSDCEDHAILFSRLVRDLIGLKVLLVYYKTPESRGEHLAAAVHFDKAPSMGNGDAFIYENEYYYVCDPTNWDPRPGVTMEGMSNRGALVILLN